MSAQAIDLRNRYQASAGSGGISAGEQRLLKALDDSIARMRKAAQSSKTEVARGQCGSAEIVASASATNGDSAMASAGVPFGFSPGPLTSNFVVAATDNSTNYSYGEGLYWAHTSAYEYGSCMSYAYADVSCQDGAIVSAIDYSVALACKGL
jgi:hypothetical protein